MTILLAHRILCKIEEHTISIKGMKIVVKYDCMLRTSKQTIRSGVKKWSLYNRTCLTLRKQLEYRKIWNLHGQLMILRSGMKERFFITLELHKIEQNYSSKERTRTVHLMKLI